MIRELTVENFKAFHNQALPLAPLTVLTGLNGSGKSSLIQALLLLRQSYESGNLANGVLAINGTYVKLGAPADARNESAADDHIAFSVRSDDQPESRFSFVFRDEEDRFPRTEINNLQLGTDGLFGNGFVFLAADRVSPQIFYDASGSESSTGKLGIHGERTAHYLSLHGEEPIVLSNAAHPRARSPQLVHQVEAWMSELSPGVQIHAEKQPSLDVVSLSYSFISRRDTSRKYRAPNVGFGVTYVLPVLTAILSSKPGDLLVIESPEAHLHPRGQARLGELLSLCGAAGVQIIAETHSDHLFNGIRVAVHQDQLPSCDVVLFYFRWNPSSDNLSTTVEKILIDSDGRIERWPEGFFDEFDRSLDILLSPKPQR